MLVALPSIDEVKRPRVAKRLVEVAFVVVPAFAVYVLRYALFATVRAVVEAKPRVEDAVTVRPLIPVKILFATSQPEVSIVSVSPPSPIVRLPVVVSVPEILFEPMVPPMMVRASEMYESPMVVEAETTPVLFAARTPPDVPKVRFVRYAFCAVRPVVEAKDVDAVVARKAVAKRLVDDAFVVVPFVAK